MKNRTFLPEVSSAIEDYFKSSNVTQAMAAQLLGVTPQAVSLQLKQPFGKNVSMKWSHAFGFNKEFLMTGKGELIEKPVLTPNEKGAYDAANVELEKIQQGEQKDHSIYKDTCDVITDDLRKEDEYYRKKDFDSLVNDSQWDTTNDFNIAVELREIYHVHTSDLSVERDYYIKEYAKIQEEKKKLYIENNALRRLLKAKESK